MPSYSETQSTRRRGTVYIAVLGVALIVGVIGIASLHVARIELRESMAVDEIARARLAARSGIECVIAKIKSDLLWRTTNASGVAGLLSVLSGNLSDADDFTYTLTDTDGNLSDDSEDAVTVRCVGTAGKARHVIEVLLAPTGAGLSCLETSLHAGGNITIGATITTDQTVSANGDISSAGSIYGNAWAVGNISGGSPTGTKSQHQSPAKEMPDTTGVFQYYMSVGTPITYAQIPGGAITDVVLSSTNNPYGSQVPNQQGIYVINCQGNSLTIRNSRIQGTIVLLNAGAGTTVRDSVNWEPLVANFPALMVQGSFTLTFSSQQNLIESTLGVNFNPGHTPYQGSADSDMSDTYPSLMKGLIYATNNLSITNQVALVGATVVGGNITTNAATLLDYKSVFATDAPPGFTSGTNMEIVPGTWKQAAY